MKGACLITWGILWRHFTATSQPLRVIYVGPATKRANYGMTGYLHWHRGILYFNADGTPPGIASALLTPGTGNVQTRHFYLPEQDPIV